MDADHFDAAARFLVEGASRRRVLAGLAAGALILGVKLSGEGAVAGKRKKRKKKPLKRNAFGCVPVDKPCRGRDNVCCSGICQGKTPKKGEKDESRCVAHDTGGCLKGHHTPFCGGADLLCTTSQGFPFGFCETTTGNAGFCGAGVSCSDCRTDANCQEQFSSPFAACIRCASCADGTGCTGA